MKYIQGIYLLLNISVKILNYLIHVCDIPKTKRVLKTSKSVFEFQKHDLFSLLQNYGFVLFYHFSTPTGMISFLLLFFCITQCLCFKNVTKTENLKCFTQGHFLYMKWPCSTLTEPLIQEDLKVTIFKKSQ